MRPRDRRGLLTVAAVSTAVCGLVALTQSGDGDGSADAMIATTEGAPATGSTPLAAATGAADAATTAAGTAAAPTATVAAGTAGSTDGTAAQAEGTATPAGQPAAVGLQDLDGESLTVEDGCVLEGESVRAGNTGADVMCVQKALLAAGFYSGEANGVFDTATAAAVRALQEDRNLFVDGVVGRESAISLGVWPDEESFVVRTPPPPAGAVDLMGFPLSSVASAGSDAPPLPENSGSGRRLVYERRGQRVWAVDDDGTIIRSWLVSGSKYSNELPGVHQVYSKSEVSTAWNGQAYLPKMVRWLQTDIGHIGFHGIPTKVSDGSAYQTEAELGQRLSGGCQRQANRDADFVWAFADIGTTVVVL